MHEKYFMKVMKRPHVEPIEPLGYMHGHRLSLQAGMYTTGRHDATGGMDITGRNGTTGRH